MSDPLNTEYFKNIEETVEKLYELAKKTREKNLDPSPLPEIALANDLAARVEGLVGPKGVAQVIRELQEKLEREEVAFQIAKDIVYEKFGNMSDEESAEQAIRTALAILSSGITAAPLEGIAKVKIKPAADSKRYLSIYFSGPIRAAGGTETALTVLVGDFVRRLMHLDRYNPSSDEVERYIEEVDLYKRAVHLQYPSSDEEIRKAIEHLPVEVTGEPTEKIEVSGYRDIPSIETNRVRGGAMLVLNDGILGKAHKLPKIISKIGLEGWEWLNNLKELKSKKETETSDSKRMTSDKYLADVIAGRPVFAHPSRPGGFRPRYGRARNTGLAAVGIHPATMEILDEFLATGTHVVTERPGKGAIVVPVDSVEGPIVKLKDGSVHSLGTVEEARSHIQDTEKILYLGDMLIAYGEFLENNHPLINSGYCEEWWTLELKNALMKSSIKKEDLRANLNISTDDLDQYIENPFCFYPKPVEALKLSQSLKIPLHPRYTYLWHDILPEELNNLLEWLMQAKMKYAGEFCSEIRVDNTNLASKNILEKLCVPHIVEKDKIVISHHAPTLAYCLGIQKDITLEKIRSKFQTTPMMRDVLFIINALSDIEVRAKAPIFIGGRLGRPEKSKARATSPPVHVLFPVGFNVGHNRNIVDIAKNGDASLELVRKECPDCHYTSFMNLCPRCGRQTVIALKCPKCSTVSRKNVCPNCKTPIRGFESQKVSLQQLLDEALRKTGVSHIEKVKGVKGLTSKFKQPEILEKGILRSKYGLYVYKDGTTRFDATDAPLSHFKSKEIKTSIETLKALGYTHDYMGNPLTDDDQILELKVQDIIIHDECGDYLVNVAKFIDELLVKVYEQPPFYNITKKEQLIGHLVIGLAPHTSAGVTARIVGFTDAYVCYAHHYFHAAKRRNCLFGTEEMPIWDVEKHQLILTPISEIIEKSILKGANTEIVDDFGTMAVENLYPQWNVVSIDETTNEPIFQPIKHWIKGKSNNWVKIRTETGRILKMTPDHIALVWNQFSQTITRTKAKQLKTGDYIPIVTKLPLPILKPPSRINVLKELAMNLSNDTFQEFKHNVRLRNAEKWMKSKILQYARNNSLCDLSKHYKRIPSQVRKHLLRLLPEKPLKKPRFYDWSISIPLSHLEALQREGVFKWDDIPDDATIGMARDDHTVNPYIPYSTDFMRLLGYLIAEGYIRDEGTCYQTNFSVPDPNLRNHVEYLIKEILGSTPYHKKDNQQLVHTGRIHAYLFAYAWRIGKTALKKRIPNFIFTTPLDYRFHFLSALIDGDGSIIPRSVRTTIYTGNYKLAQDYCLLLSTLGILARLSVIEGGRYGEKVLERYKELGVEPKTDNPLYHVNIPGRENELLFSNITLKHKEKLERVKKILKKGYPEPKGFEEIAENVIADKIKEIEIINSKMSSYCLEVDSSTELKQTYHNIVMQNGMTTAQCDGDEDSVILLLDGLLNFSKKLLPAKRGGMMDAPLVLTVCLDPHEIDDESYTVDQVANYSLEFYHKTLDSVDPKDVEDIIDNVGHRLNTPALYAGFRFSHPTSSIAAGPSCTAYKTLDSMEKKVIAQLNLAKKIRAVNAKDVAERVFSHHLLRDIVGCLRRFGRQKVRCTTCNRKYRRIPLSGKCPNCGGKLILTVSEGTVMKYLDLAEKIVNGQDLDLYHKQRIILLKKALESLFEDDAPKQVKLGEYI
jgi:DNA polymerase II large subunit